MIVLALVIALACYLIGFEKGIMAALVVGALSETVFWLGIMGRSRAKRIKARDEREQQLMQ